MEQIDKRKILEIADGELVSISDSAEKTGPLHWTIDDGYLSDFPKELLPALHGLAERHTSAFESDLYDPLMIYSRHSISRDPSDKLFYILVGLESMLLANESEPIQSSIAERMAFLVGRDLTERQAIYKNAKTVYGLRSSFVHHGNSISDEESLAEFMGNAWQCFCNLLLQRGKFETQAQLIERLNALKLS